MTNGNFLRASLLAFAVALPGAPALAAGGDVELAHHEFSFSGMFGGFDQAQLQRGLQVYREICAGCHGLKYVSFRTLADENGPGMSEDAVRVIASEYEVQDEEGLPGDTRPAKTFDYFPTPQAEGNPPDMSLLAKARPGGADHIYSILTGYEEAPECAADAEMGGYYNVAFGAGAIPDSCKDDEGHAKIPGSWINMAQPVDDEFVEYADGAPMTLEQYAEDVSAFLMWAAEPKMVERKQAGVWSLAFLAIFAVLLWFTNRKVWAPLKHPEDHG